MSGLCDDHSKLRGTVKLCKVMLVDLFAALCLLGLFSRVGAVVPCIYEGHVKTDKDWYGWLANVTIKGTGRMEFQFTYPAEKCCQNILIYPKAQMTILTGRMGCWQKESLLKYEEDQMLRLTPRFHWSGCYMTHPGGVATYFCKGGRSFTSRVNGDQPEESSWYIAASNCAGLHGIELRYRIEFIGHIGECKSSYKILPTSEPKLNPAVQETQSVVSGDNPIKAKATCTVKGALNVTMPWFGYLANMTLKRGGGFRFKFSYPFHRQVQNVVLYNEEDVEKLHSEQSCWQKEGVIRSRHVTDQILDLSFRSSWNGCVTNNNTKAAALICQGERRYNKPRKIYMAVSNCRSSHGLLLNYELNFHGYEGNVCNVANLYIPCFFLYILPIVLGLAFR